MLIPLDYPLPHRKWVETAHGWTSRDWAPGEYEEAARELFKTDEVRVRPDLYPVGWRFA